MGKYVIYHEEPGYNFTDNNGYYCGSYTFQGAKYGVFYTNLERAKRLGLKTYSTFNRAELAKTKLIFENAHFKDMKVKVTDGE